MPDSTEQVEEVRTREGFYSQAYYKGLAPEPRFQVVARIFARLRGERLLDVGCGDGSFTQVLVQAMKPKEVYGVEIAPAAVTAAEEKGIKALQVDLDREPLPFESNWFDSIYCGEVIEHVFDPEHLLEEVHRVLKPGGTLVLSTPNLAGWPNRLALLLGYQPYSMAASPQHEGAGKLLVKGSQGQWGHIRVMTLGAVKELLRLHGFRIDKVLGCPVTLQGSSSRVFLALLRLVDKLMARIPSLSTRVVLVVEKR